MIKPTYYYIVPKRTDAYGLTHGYRGYINQQLNATEDFSQNAVSTAFKSDDYREGAPRLYEVPRFNATIYPYLLVSENVKEFLSILKLPHHRYTPVSLDHNKLTTQTDFFLLQLKKNTLLEYLDWEQSDFFFTYTTRPRSDEGQMVVESKLTSIDDLNNEKERIKERYNARTVEIHPSVIYQLEHFDMATYYHPKVLGKVILVPDYIKTAFEKYFPDQVDFFSADKLDVQVDAKAYLERKMEVERLQFTPGKLTFEVEEEFLFYANKMNRLMKDGGDFPISSYESDEFSEKEKELKKIFPESFKTFYRSNPQLQGFELQPIKHFYIEGNYQSSLPETYGAVIFAEDGSGEGIGLLLKKESDYELGDQWYYFSHEDGLIFEIKDLSNYIVE